MDFQIQDMSDWFESNKEWVLIPGLIILLIEVIGFVLLILFGGGVSIILKVLIILLLFLAPVIGYLLGEVLSPILSPVFDMIHK